MLKTSIIGVFFAAFGASQAAVIDFFNDQNCGSYSYTRNIYDNSCASTGGFQSYRITSGGGSGQVITTYSRNNCSGGKPSCVYASQVGTCYSSYNGNGGSNAVSSGTGCGIS